MKKLSVVVCGAATPGCDCYRCRLERLDHSLRELTQLVADMRHAQRTYFRLRSTASLYEAKKREAAVDECLGRLSTPRLFGDEG